MAAAREETRGTDLALVWRKSYPRWHFWHKNARISLEGQRDCVQNMQIWRFEIVRICDQLGSYALKYYRFLGRKVDKRRWSAARVLQGEGRQLEICRDLSEDLCRWRHRVRGTRTLLLSRGRRRLPAP